MYQESDDRIGGSGKKDALIFALLIAFFLLAGTIATILRTRFNSNVPLYALAVIFGAALYFVYKLRIVGWRYTVFYKEPEKEYDARFDEYVEVEEHAYPVGTVVFERTVSAKGEILAAIGREDIITLLEPGEEYSADSEVVYGVRRKEDSASLVCRKDGRTVRIYFNPTEEFKGHVRSILN